MAALKWKISQLHAAHESSYGVDPSSNGSGYQFIKMLPDATWQPTADIVDRQGQINDLSRVPHEVGAKGGTLNFKMELKASGTPAASATAAIAAESSLVLEAALGTVARGTGTTVAASGGNGNPTPMKVASAAGLAKYMAIEVESQVRVITAISGVDITLNRALSGVPATSAVVYASSRFSRANSGHKSMAFVTTRDGVQYTLLGCAVSAKIVGVTARGTAILEVTAQVGDWEVTSKASLPTASILTGISAVRAPVVKGAPFFVDTTERLISSLDFDMGSVFAFQDTTSGAQAKSGIELVDAQPQGVFKSYHQTAHLTDFLAGTERAIEMVVGSRTNGFVLYIPKAQLGQPTLNDHNGMVGEDVPFMVNDNGSDNEYVLSVF